MVAGAYEWYASAYEVNMSAANRHCFHSFVVVALYNKTTDAAVNFYYKFHLAAKIKPFKYAHTHIHKHLWHTIINNITWPYVWHISNELYYCLELLPGNINCNTTKLELTKLKRKICEASKDEWVREQGRREREIGSVWAHSDRSQSYLQWQTIYLCVRVFH